MRDGIFFFKSFYEVGRKLSPRDRLSYYDALLGYAFEDIEPTNLKGYPEIGFISAKPVLDADKQKYINGQKAAIHGSKGGRPKVGKNPEGFEKNNPGGFENSKGSENPLNNKNKNIKQEQEYSIEKEKPSHPTTTKFIPPTEEEVAAYIQEKGYSVNAAHFYAYYQSNGWRVGKNPMKSWQGAVRTWELKEKSNGNGNNRTSVEDRLYVGHNFSEADSTI